MLDRFLPSVLLKSDSDSRSFSFQRRSLADRKKAYTIDSSGLEGAHGASISLMTKSVNDNFGSMLKSAVFSEGLPTRASFSHSASFSHAAGNAKPIPVLTSPDYNSIFRRCGALGGTSCLTSYRRVAHASFLLPTWRGVGGEAFPIQTRTWGIAGGGGLRSAILRNFAISRKFSHDCFSASPRCVLVGALCVPDAEVLFVEAWGGLGTAPQLFRNSSQLDFDAP